MEKPNQFLTIVHIGFVLTLAILVSCTADEEERVSQPTLPEIWATATDTVLVATNTAEPGAATPFQPPTLVATMTGEPTPTAVITATPEAIIEPAVTAARIFPHSWSPDSRIFAYWIFTEEEVALDFTLPPGTLHFLNIIAGESCPSLVDVPYGYFDSTLTWLPDGRVQVRTEEGVMEGTPCHDNFILAQSSHFTPANASLSPGGDYYIYTIESAQSRFTTTLTDAASSNVLTTVEWQPALSGLGEIGDGGHWIDNNHFLITETEQGPLLLTGDGEIITIVTHLFEQSIETVCEIGTSCETAWAAMGAVDLDTGSYHIILYGVGVGNFPPIHLFHSESGFTEILSFQHHVGFAPDGRTLLLFTDDFAERPRYRLWARSVDPPYSEPHLLLASAVNPIPVVWSPDSTLLVASSAQGITIHSISGNVFALWQTPGWKTLTPADWSSDGYYLIVHGLSSSADPKEALFVVYIPDEVKGEGMMKLKHQ